MYSEMKKNIENSDMPISRAIVSAPRSVRRRKIENGISDARKRSSITRTAESSTRKPGRDGDGAGNVEDAWLRLGTTVEQQALRKQHADHADRHVHEQHPAPGEAAREHATEQHSGGAACARHGAPHAESAVALGAFG